MRSWRSAIRASSDLAQVLGRLAELLVLEVVHVHALRIAFGTIIGSAILEVANQFFLLGIYAYHRISMSQEEPFHTFDVPELTVTIRMGRVGASSTTLSQVCASR